jgi:AcrR family transcriptional regulator
LNLDLIPHNPKEGALLQYNLEAALAPPPQFYGYGAAETIRRMPNKNELRTRETRELLIRSAETVFVRDGYERADLAQIAALAGRTKGAIYGQFKSKEDLFIALFAERMSFHSRRMYENLAGSTSIEQNVRIFREYYLQSLGDKNWSLLMLEFKLFALRHPDTIERLQQVHSKLLPQYREEEMVKVFGSEGEGPAAIQRTAAISILGPLLSALTIESQFTHALLDGQAMKNIVTRLFDALFIPPEK